MFIELDKCFIVGDLSLQFSLNSHIRGTKLIKKNHFFILFLNLKNDTFTSHNPYS